MKTNGPRREMMKEMHVPDIFAPHSLADAFVGRIDVQRSMLLLIWVLLSEGQLVIHEGPFFVNIMFTIHCTWTYRETTYREPHPVPCSGCTSSPNSRSSEERNWL